MNLWLVALGIWVLSRSNFSNGNCHWVTFQYQPIGVNASSMPSPFSYQVCGPKGYNKKTVGWTDDKRRRYECWLIEDQPLTRIDITSPDGTVINTRMPMMVNRGEGYYAVYYKPNYKSGTITSKENFGYEGYYYANPTQLVAHADVASCLTDIAQWMDAYNQPNVPTPDDNATPDDNPPPSPEGDPEGEQGGGLGGGFGGGFGPMSVAQNDVPDPVVSDNFQLEINRKINPLNVKQTSTVTSLNGKVKGGWG